MKKTVIYIRQSLNTDKQKHSLDMQKSICLELAKKNDWVVHEIYDENVMSARKTELDERPVLNRLLNDVREGSIGRIIVFKRDRIARNVQQYIQVVRLLQQKNVDLYFSADNEPPMFKGVASEFIEVLLAGIAQHEADNIVRRLIQAKKQVMRDGKWAAGKPPFAYTMGNEGGVLEIINERVNIVKVVYERFLEIAPKVKDFQLIYAELKKDPTLNKLTKVQVWKIIEQPLHKGLLVQKLDGETFTIPKEELRIIKDEQWEDANRFLATLNSPCKIEKVIDEIPLLSNLIYCEECGVVVNAKSKVYKCHSCKKEIGISLIDEKVIQHVLNYLKKKGSEEWENVIFFLRNRYLKPFEVMVRNYETNISALEKEIKTNFRHYIETTSGELLLQSLIKDYQEKSKLLEKVKTTGYHMNEYLEKLDRNLINNINTENLTQMQKQHLIKLVSRVTVKGSQLKKIAVYAVKGV